jgi:transcription termination/antitermination protein NusG
MSEETLWYVVHTYSGYENKVKANIEKIVENRGMQEQILEVIVPMQDIVEVKNGKKKTVSSKIFPGYVLINMNMNDDTWYVVRNTRGVTSFVGPGSKPVPVSNEEIAAMGIQVEQTSFEIEIGEGVKITKGPFQDSIGTLKEINFKKNTVIVTLVVFDRETPVELGFTEIKRV